MQHRGAAHGQTGAEGYLTVVESWVYRNIGVTICMRNMKMNRGPRECRYTRYCCSTQGVLDKEDTIGTDGRHLACLCIQQK